MKLANRTIRLLLTLTLLLAPLAEAKDKKPKPPPRALTSEEMLTAYNVAVNTISARLKAPSTAKFSSFEDAVESGRIFWVNTLIIKNRIGVTLAVDAQNSYGAMLRNIWTCYVGKQRADGLYPVNCIERQ